LEQFQNQGFGRKLFDAGIDQIRHTKIYSKKIYTVSRNPKVIKMMKKYDFVGSYNVLNLPVEINIDSFWYFCNFMRLKEIIRKYFYYKNQSKFWYGVRL
jgi:ribosomal protein S18 acetylase RimI-like enzyme